MSHFDFKTRFIAALPPVPPGLDLHWDQFVTFDPDTLSALDAEDAAFLIEQSLPCDASPFLSFAAYTPNDIEERLSTLGLPQACFPIGHNGSGDIIGVDTKTREVVYFNHDASNLRVFINSTLSLFAEGLCIYQEHLRAGVMRSCLSAIEKIDARAVEAGSMWRSEVDAEIANG